MNPQPKNNPFRSKMAREWFRTQPCDACGTSGDGLVTGHHEPLNGHGTSSKGPDDEQIPFCLECHMLRHRKGKDSFYDRGCIDWRKVVERYKGKVHKHLNGRKKNENI